MNRPAATDDAAVRHSLAQLMAPPPSLLEQPLDFIFADHFRQRSLCAVLRGVARSRSVPRECAQTVLAFFAHDLPLHHQDEDADLFPALIKRAHPEDALSTILARLSDDHRQASPLIADIVAALSVEPQADVITIPVDAAEPILAYVASEQRHLSVENGIVLVIARKRLASSDLSRMSRAMKSRRGIEVP